MDHPIVFSIFLIFFGAAVFATLALFARQSVLVAYIVLGAVIGPYGLAWINDATLVKEFAHVGIIFLLFLLGLNLQPQKLLSMLREASLVTLASSVVFGGITTLVVKAFGFDWQSALIVGSGSMFSSTIIGLKLLPTTALHHKRTGEILISVLLLQDLLAILIMLVLRSLGDLDFGWSEGVRIALTLPAFFALAILLARFVLHRLFARFNRIHEYLFLVTIGWCLAGAELAQSFGLSQEIGAFAAGIAIASSPIARFIAESLKPLRDFFLVMFFFGMGAEFDITALPSVAAPAAAVAALMLLGKPWTFKTLFGWADEAPQLAREMGVRLGQIGEFAFLIAFLARDLTLIDPRAYYLIQFSTLITLIVSSYWIVLRYPTPLAISERLRRD